MKLLAIGPMPPPEGGTTLLFKQFIDYIKNENDIDYFLIDTNKRNSLNRFGPIRFCRILCLVLLNACRCDIVSLHVSKPSLIFLFPFVFFLTKIFDKKLVVRKFGGDFYQSMLKNSFLINLVVKMMSYCDRVYFETKKEVEVFNKKTKKTLAFWMPNSREKKIESMFDDHAKKLSTSFDLVFIGNVTKEKGILDLVQASKNIKDLKVSIYGPCMDDRLLDEIKKIDNCFYHGVVSSDAVASIIHANSALCLPTYYSGEGYPGVIIEAFSVGVPVISTFWGCIPEIVTEDINGLLVKIKDPTSLRQAIIRLMTDRPLLEFLAVNAKSSFCQFESLSVHKKFLEGHRSLLEI